MPPGLDWDAFLGPAPMRPFNENRYRYNWHWFWDTGNGDMGNQGIHEMDIARWGLNASTWPAHAVATGGKFLYDDDQETPNMELATFDYGGTQLMFEVRGLITGADAGLDAAGPNVIGDIFYGSDGYMIISAGSYRVMRGENHEAGPAERAAGRRSQFVDRAAHGELPGRGAQPAEHRSSTPTSRPAWTPRTCATSRT